MVPVQEKRAKMMSVRLALALALMLAGPGVQTASAAPRKAAVPALPSPATARALGDRVAAWQLANLDPFEYVTRYRDETLDRRSWVQAAFYIGLLEYARATGNGGLRSTVQNWASGNDYRLGRVPYHADDQAVGRVYVRLAQLGYANGTVAAPTRAAFDYILTAPSRADLTFKGIPGTDRVGCVSERWCWCDALFMAPPAWFAMSRITGDRRYRDFADREFAATTDLLFDKEAGLYFRDSRFIKQRSEAGAKLFWSRGNGWVIAGLIHVLEQLPAGDPSRARYEDLLRRMAGALAAAQAPSGFWTASLLEPGTPPEASGTAFFVYGIKRGVDLGILPAARFSPVAARGWAALAGAIGPDGRLGRVQQIGDRPDAVGPEDSQLYGSGAFLLAASAMIEGGRAR